MTVYWNDEALARGGWDRQRADEILALANELVDLPSKVLTGPRRDESPEEWAERVMTGSARPKKTPQVVYTESEIDRMVQLWSKLYRDN
jgi:hypothetical protein